MKIELLKNTDYTFKEIKVGETFVYAGSPFVRVKHTEASLIAVAGKKSVVISGSGLAVNLSNGFVTLISDSNEVKKADFWLKEIK